MFEGLLTSTSERELEVGELVGDILNDILNPITITTPEKVIQLGTHKDGVSSHKKIELK